MITDLVSIVTVVRNDRKGLRRTMESVLAQDFPGLEYVVVDGASTDGTLDLIRANADRLSAWISEPDGGVYDAMNKGWRLATGDWVVFLNAGDWFLDPGVVSAAMAAAGPQVEAVYGDALYLLGEQRHFMPAGHPEALPMGPFCCHQSLFMRRRMLEHLGGFRLAEWPAADYGLIARAHAAGCRWQGVARPFVAYALGGISDVHAGRGRRMAWAISREVFGTSWGRQLRWSYRLGRDLLRGGLRKAGLGGLVRAIQQCKAWVRRLGPAGRGAV